MIRYFLIIVTGLFLYSAERDFVDKRFETISFKNPLSKELKGRLWFSDDDSPDILVIYVAPSLNVTLPPDTLIKNRFNLELRHQIIKNGIMYFEFAGREDHATIYGQRIPSSTYLTKADDLECAIRYLQKRQETKNKKIVLLGQSEGGTTCLKLASTNPPVKSVILLSTSGVSGYESLMFQSEFRDTAFMTTLGTHPEIFESLNNMSSLNKKKYEQSYKGYSCYKEDMFEPLSNIVYQYNNLDTIVCHVMESLEQKWKKEDNKTKTAHRNFINYCKVHQYKSFINPANIAKLKTNPEQYMQRITIPVLAVFGTNDKKVNHRLSIKNMEKYLSSDLTVFTLKDYDHYLKPPGVEPVTIQKKQINEIVNWILKPD